MTTYRIEFDVWGPRARWHTLPVADLETVILDAPTAHEACTIAARKCGIHIDLLSLRSISEVQPVTLKRVSDALPAGMGIAAVSL